MLIEEGGGHLDGNVYIGKRKRIAVGDLEGLDGRICAGKGILGFLKANVT